jgi:poly(3-hydroxybutyrate) depolymerase
MKIWLALLAWCGITDATFAFWADRDGCGKEVRSERVPSREASQAWAERRTRSGCMSVQYVLHGSGHTWPNLRQGPVVKLLGGSNQDLDAGEVIWNFFRSTLGRG